MEACYALSLANVFMDLIIMKHNDGHLHTAVHKLTDRNTLLRADSFHPPTLKKEHCALTP